MRVYSHTCMRVAHDHQSCLSEAEVEEEGEEEEEAEEGGGFSSITLVLQNT